MALRRLLPLLCLPAALGGAALALPRPRPAAPCAAPEIRIEKSRTTLRLLCGGAERARYPATFGASPVGHKQRQGDERTPEGSYQIASKHRSDRFHRFLLISYPSAEDRRRAKAAGIADPGGAIGIHGTRADKALLGRAWVRLGHGLGLSRLWGPTDGCIGLANEDVEALYDAVPVGTRVVITP